MAKRKNESARTTLEEVNESLTGAAHRIEENRRPAAVQKLGEFRLNLRHHFRRHHRSGESRFV